MRHSLATAAPDVVPAPPRVVGSRRNWNSRRALADLLAPLDIGLDGARPWDLNIRDLRAIERILGQGSLGAGESYVDGWWDCAALDQLFARILAARLDRSLVNWRDRWAVLLARIRNPQSRNRSFTVGERHYNIGDDLYQRMLDRRMIYSCGYWRDSTTLDEAQERKLDLVCRKLRLERGMRVLDIGCGWGGAAQFAAERYGVVVTGITISKRQAEQARDRCRGLPVEIVLQDYRSLSGRYDRVFSIGMFEHVGVRNFRRYFDKVRELLTPEGLFLLHTIGEFESASTTDPWIERYIFPNSMIPSLRQVAAATERQWVIEDWQQFGPHYDRTIMEWQSNFDRHWCEIADRYSERFRRMWRYYLGVSAGAFRARHLQLWQFLLSPCGVPGGLAEVR